MTISQHAPKNLYCFKLVFLHALFPFLFLKCVRFSVLSDAPAPLIRKLEDDSRKPWSVYVTILPNPNDFLPILSYLS